MEDQVRHFITILKEIESIKEKLERSYTPALQSDYEEACNMRNVIFVELLRSGYPFISLPDEDIVRMNIDEKNYDISRVFLRSFLGDEECDKILSNTSFKTVNISEEEAASYDSEFVQLKEKFDSKLNENTDTSTSSKTSSSTTTATPTPSTEDTASTDNANEEPPILDYFINKNGRAKRINTTEFAFMGLQHGAGTTHSAIMFAQALVTEEDCDIAYFEANDSCNMSNLIKWHTGQDAVEKFSLNGVDFYCGIDYLTFVAKYKDMYDYVIVDFGVYSENMDLSDFIRIPIKFIISSGIDWNLPKLEDFYNSFKYDKIHGITYLIPYFSQNDDMGYIKNITYPNKTIGVPFNFNPFEPSEEIVSIFKNLVGLHSEESNNVKVKKKNILDTLFKKK